MDEASVASSCHAVLLEIIQGTRAPIGGGGVVVLGAAEAHALVLPDGALQESVCWREMAAESAASVFYYTAIHEPTSTPLSLPPDEDEHDLRWQDFINNSTFSHPFSNIGVPLCPYYLILSKAIMSWSVCGVCPRVFVAMDGFVETANDIQRIQDKATSIIADSHGVWQSLSHAERLDRMSCILSALTFKGILTLLGLRTTQGSLMCTPPPIGTLLRSCNIKHTPQSSSLLSVAGRALCKHCIRSHDGFWGGMASAVGPDRLKNRRAEALVKAILTTATWMNIHLLPHDLPVYEVRNIEGYGLRWSADGTQFRGFLEPQMADGHEKGWHH